MKIILNWLNGNKDYWTGVSIYKAYGKSELYKKMFATNNSSFNAIKLEAELRKLVNISTPTAPPSAAPKIKDYSETELYKVSKNKTDKFYKEVMNMRAVLFAMVDAEEDLTLINTPEKIAQRKPLCLKIVPGYRQVSMDYDDVDYIKKNGMMPHKQEDSSDLNIDDIPDDLVFKKLDNARKNYNKMFKREHTPERVQMLQEREALIKKLEKRWQLLQESQKQ